MAILVAVSVVLATSLLTALSSSLFLDTAVKARLDSHQVWSIDAGDSTQPLLTMAIAPVVNPKESYQAWGEAARYLERKLSLPMAIIHRRRYADVNEMLETGEAQLALICAGPYVMLRRQGIVKLLVVPRVHGLVTYRSLLLVPATSNAHSMADLRGKSFAFSDPLSNSGYLYPTFVLHQLGEAPGTFFSRTVFTYGHDRSVLSVANGFSDAAAVDSLVYDTMRSERPETIGRLRVIQKSPPFGTNPIVVGRHVSADLVARLRAVLVAMNEDERGHEVLHDLNIDAFQLGDPHLYKGVEEMLDALGR